MRAAVDLVSERGTSYVAVSDIAETADVSRQLLYQQFGDRDTLLLEAALDLVRRELMPHFEGSPEAEGEQNGLLIIVRYFAEHRTFYRALLTGPCSYEVGKSLTDLFAPFNERIALQMTQAHPPPHLVEDLAAFVTGGFATVVNTWLVEGEDPLDAQAFTDRLTRTLTAITDATCEPAGHHQDRSASDESD